MRQVFSDAATLMVQGALSWVAVTTLLWGVYVTGMAPNYSGFVGWVEFAAWFASAAFVGVSIAGAAMWVADLLFYHVQVFCHGPPTDHVTDDTD